FLPVFLPDRSRSRCANIAPGRWPSRYCCSPSAGLARSCRQSKTRQWARFFSTSSVETSVEPFMEVDLRVFHRRLVRAGVVEPLLVERAAAAVEALADLVILER